MKRERVRALTLMVVLSAVACGSGSGGRDGAGGAGGAAGMDGSGGAGGNPGAVDCFGTMCELVAGGCCTVSSHQCMSACNGPYDHFFCDGSEDCNGQHCCGYIGAEVNGSYCASSCSPWNTLCHSGADCPTTAPNCDHTATGYPSGVCVP